MIRSANPSQTVQTRTAPVWDPQEERFKLWVISTDESLRLSRDGLHWTKPSLGQVEVNGTRENSYITIDEKLGWPANAIMNVVIDPDDPDPARRFKGLGDCTNRHPLISPDGIHWRKLGVPTITSADESNLSYDRQAGMFIATVKGSGPHGRSVHLSTSKDFETWTNHGLIFHADDEDQQLGRKAIKARLADPDFLPPYFKPDPSVFNVDVYNMGIFRYESLYIGMPSMYHATSRIPNYANTEGFHLVHLASSRDLKNWTRHGDRKPFIGSSRIGSGAYDLTQILGPSDAVRRGEELWFYYTGLKYRGGRVLKDGKWVPGPGFKPDPDGGGICLAVLRRDGFISLDAGEQEGTIQTGPFKLPGTKLLVNVDAPKGELRVELLNGDGNVVAKSKPLTGDLLREPVKWAKGDIAGLKDQTASLRFTLRNGQFYSYWLE